MTRALDDGSAAERFAHGGRPGRPGQRAGARGGHLPSAPVQRVLAAPRDGVFSAMDTRKIGLVIVALGGGAPPRQRQRSIRAWASRGCCPWAPR